MHRLTAQIFTNRRPQNRSPVAVAREWGHACALEMQIPPFPTRIFDFAQQERPPVTQLRHIDAELMARVEHGERVHARDEQAASEQAGEFRSLRFVRMQVDQRGGRWIETHQVGWLRKRSRVELGIKDLRQSRVGIVEGKVFQCAEVHASVYHEHGASRHRRRPRTRQVGRP
jgi:hypothetical protein